MLPMQPLRRSSRNCNPGTENCSTSGRVHRVAGLRHVGRVRFFLHICGHYPGLRKAAGEAVASKKSKVILRREFLISASGVAGSALAGVSFSAERPCPPPSFTITGGTSVTSACVASNPGSLPAITLTSSAASGQHAWTFGHAFRKGDVPAGTYITSDATNTQAEVRNRWSDGSVKFAVVSGLASFMQNSPRAIQLATTSSPPSSSTVPEPSSINVSLSFSGAVSGTYSLQSLLGVDRSTWNKAAGGRVRSIRGPVMSEFHYYCPTSDAHVAIWFYLRCYSGGAMEVETVVENGWMGVASPGQKDYSVSLNINGSTRYSGSLNHFHHARWSRVDWVGVDPLITPKHDVAYLRASKLVPNYGYTSPSSSAFNGMATALNPAPFALGNWTANMGNAGAQDPIGLLPRWEALYCTSADARAYAATISNQRGSGRWPIHYRDENTGRPALHSSYSNRTIYSGWGSSPPSPSGGTNAWDIPHHPSTGYLPYLIEGRWPALESIQFTAILAILDTNPATRQGGGVVACINAPMTTRGAAWSWRSVGQAAAISPTSLGNGLPAADGDVQESLAASVSNTATWAKRRYIDGSVDGGAHRNSIGWLGQYDAYGSGASGTEWWGGSWMVQFQSLALGHISDLEIENLAAPADLAAMRNHSYDNCLQQLGDDSSWNFRHGAVYDRPYLKGSSNPHAPDFMTVAESYAAYRAAKNIGPSAATAGLSLKAHSSDVDMNAGDSSNDGSGFWAVALSVLSMAVEHGKAGAQAKRNLVAAASNYDPGAHGAHNNPVFAIVPR